LNASSVENPRILHHPIRANSSEPNGSAAPGLPILDRMSDDLKADAVEQRCIFVRAQAGVIERVAPILPNAFTMGWPAIEHQDGRWRGVSSEHVEHPTLVVWSQVKEAIPSEHTVELTGKL
jgi:hypothetical protein